MSRQYHEHIEVQFGEVLLGRLRETALLHAGSCAIVPTAFVWRNRHHVVRAVVAQWTQRLPWWRMSGAADADAWSLQQNVWRVEASVGSALSTGIYDLAQDERWRLLRVVD